MTSSTPLQIATFTAGAIALPGLVQIETSPARHGTLIRTDLIAIASHYVPPFGVAVTADGLTPSTIKDYALQIGDVTILRLSNPIEGAPVATIATMDEISGTQSFVGVGFANINTAGQRRIAARPLFQRVSSDTAAEGAKVLFFKQTTFCKVEKGDSGSPVYVQTPEGYKLAGVFTSMNLMSSTASLLSPFRDRIVALQ